VSSSLALAWSFGSVHTSRVLTIVVHLPRGGRRGPGGRFVALRRKKLPDPAVLGPGGVGLRSEVSGLLR
jgi:hypothetical protein